MTVESLEAALDALGIPCTVEAHERLAVIVPRGEVSALEDARHRRETVRLAREHGFTHIALELVEQSPAAPDDSGAGASAGRRAPVHRD